MLITVYVFAGLCELAGVAIGLLELRAAVRDLNEYLAPLNQDQQFWDRDLNGRSMTVIHRTPEAVKRILVGNIKPRLIAIGLLVGGIVLGTVANVWAAMST